MQITLRREQSYIDEIDFEVGVSGKTKSVRKVVRSEVLDAEGNGTGKFEDKKEWVDEDVIIETGFELVGLNVVHIKAPHSVAHQGGIRNGDVVLIPKEKINNIAKVPELHFCSIF